MGMFSWKTADTGKTLVSTAFTESAKRRSYPHVSSATLLLPLGEKVNGHYDGYGCLIDGNGQRQDIFCLVYRDLFEANAPKDICQQGCEGHDPFRNKAFKKYDEVSKNIKLVEDASLSYDNVKTSPDCPSQGFMF